MADGGCSISERSVREPREVTQLLSIANKLENLVRPDGFAGATSSSKFESDISEKL